VVDERFRWLCTWELGTGGKLSTKSTKPHPNSPSQLQLGHMMIRSAATKLLKRPFSSASAEKVWNVYLSGEIHSDWREVISNGIASKNLPVKLTSPNTSHEDSDDCGAIILGMEEKRTNWDKIGANMNNIRTKTLIRDADVVVVRFGEKYRQWNAAFDAGYAAALNKSIITLHPPNISHMLKEVNASASVVCEDAEQVVDTLAYVIRGELPERPRDGEEFVPIADRLGAGNPNP
jgi:YtoQ family protein